MRPVRFSALITALFFISIFSSCATIIHGTKQKIGITSSPTGATVIIDNDSVGVTPMFYKLKRKEDYIVTIKSPGYQKAQLVITSSVSGWVWGNIIFGGLIGLAIDAISGGLYELSPAQLNAELQKEGTSAINKRDGIYILSALHIDPSWHRIGRLASKN